MLASARITCDFLNLSPGDTALLCLPLDYIAGKMMVVRSIERGLRLYDVPPSNHPFASVLEECGMPREFSLVALVPSQVYSSLQVPEERECLMRARNIIIGGGAISAELERELRSFPNAVWSTYGMTETLSHVALRRVGESDYYTPFDSVHVSINDDGCLVIDAPEVCAETLVTNDIAELHPDGRRFRIRGRRDNVICSGGVKLQIEEMEAQLRSYIPVQFYFTKKADEKFGEVPVLVIADCPSHSDDSSSHCASDAVPHHIDDAELLSLCRSHLAKYAIPKAIIHVSSLPLTETGKVRRILLG